MLIVEHIGAFIKWILNGFNKSYKSICFYGEVRWLKKIDFRIENAIIGYLAIVLITILVINIFF